jgi:hypothetical protein
VTEFTEFLDIQQIEEFLGPFYSDKVSDVEKLERGVAVRCASCGSFVFPDGDWYPGFWGEVICRLCYDARVRG